MARNCKNNHSNLRIYLHELVVSYLLVACGAAYLDCFRPLTLEYYGTSSLACPRLGGCVPCLHWSNISEQEFNPLDYPDVDFVENHCRSIANASRAPSCYYQSSNGIVLEHCRVKPCNIHSGCMNGTGTTYSDAAMFTASGFSCLPWNDSSITELIKQESISSEGLDVNFCRNPDNSSRPWCFYRDPGTNITQRDLCADITQCTTDALTKFTRAIRVYISGHNRKYVRGFDVTAEECALSCLEETSFVCRSFEFRELWHHSDRRCILTNESLHSLELVDNPRRGIAIDLFTRIDTICDAYFAKSFLNSCPFQISTNLNITASSMYDDKHNPANAFLNSDSWWRPAPSNSTEWLQVTFRERMIVTALAVQGAGEGAPFWVTSFNVTYSEEGRIWWPVQDYRGNGEPHCVRTVPLVPPIRAKFVRIIPTQWRGVVALRVGAFGCLDNDCDKSAGLVDGSLQDGLITASSYLSAAYSPQTARPNPFDDRGTGWMPLQSDSHQWLRVEFPRERAVHTIATQGCGKKIAWVTSYTVEYSSLDGGDLAPYMEESGVIKVFSANSDGYSIVYNTLTNRVIARSIVISPTTWNGSICLRADFIGCIHRVCRERLGVESYKIADSQLSSSSSYSSNTPQRARLHLLAPEDNVRIGCWRPSLELTQEWLQVDLLTFHTVTGVITQGIGCPLWQWWVISYMIQYESRESDGAWRFYRNLDGSQAILTGNTDQNTESPKFFPRPFITRKVRFLPTAWEYTQPCMRVEVLGCRLNEVGDICGEGALYNNGFCIGSVDSNQADSCDVIFAEGSHLLKITSQATQDFISHNRQTFFYDLLVSRYLIGLRSAEGSTPANRVFRWWDGTPMTYQNFYPIDPLDGSGDLCVAFDREGHLQWRVMQCDDRHTYKAVICQKDINECYLDGICPDSCENIPGGFVCTCPHGHFYQSGACSPICQQLGTSLSNATVAHGETSCLISSPMSTNWVESEDWCESMLAGVASVEAISHLKLQEEVWTQQSSATNGTKACQSIETSNSTIMNIYQVSCNDTYPVICAKTFADVRFGQLRLMNITSVEVNDTFGYLHCLTYPPWYNTGSTFTIHIQGPSTLAVRFNVQNMTLRRGEGADECLDSLSIVDVVPGYGDVLRGRYCGTRRHLEIITRSNDVTATFQIGDLTSDMPLALGFVAFYEMIDCTRESCELGCGTPMHLTDTSGNFTTPNYPAPLPPFSICVWTVHVTPGRYVSLTFPEFQVVEADDVTGRCLDTAYMFEGELMETDQSNGFCGKAPPLVITESDSLTVLYRTGLQSSSLGFRAMYSVTDLPGCSVGVDFSSSPVWCEFEAAVITSPGYPTNYRPNTRHTWHITTSPATYIQVEFLDFDVPSEADCEYDHVSIFDGADTDGSGTTLGKHCNDARPPERIQSSLNRITIFFRTDGLTGSSSEHTGTGFHAVYKTMKFVPLTTQTLPNHDYDCPEDWSVYNGHCYMFYNQSTNLRWRDAEAECIKNESHLVSIRDIWEMNYIHAMLTSQWSTNQLDTYIGLTDSLREGHFHWTDGYPMSYTDWHVPIGGRPEPDGDVLEDCTMITLRSIRSTANWRDVSCASKDARQFICKKPATYTKTPVTVSPKDVMALEDMDRDCGPFLKQCDNRECTQLPFSCPHRSHNQEDQQEDNISTFEDFVCEATGQRLSISFYCDYVAQCPDQSDESSCDYPSCGPDEYQCNSGQCIDRRRLCDLIADCKDGSDESMCEICNAGFQCYDGTCLSTTAVCDGMKSCPGTRWEDEEDCLHQCDSNYQMRCNNGACANLTSNCIYDVDDYGLLVGCRDVTHLRFCESFTCPTWTLKCPSSYCIPLRMRCDGKIDCPTGEDELHCENFYCPGAYRCRDATYCVSPNELCDGVAQCPYGDDEAYCGLSCPVGCRCIGYSVDCERVEWSAMTADLLPVEARMIKLTSLLINEERSKRGIDDGHVVDRDIGSVLHFRPDRFPFLAMLNLSHNTIDAIPEGFFNNSSNLFKLTLAHNQIKELSAGTFLGLHRLIYLDITGNPLTRIEPGAFMGLVALPALDLTNLPIEILVEGTFTGLDALKNLTLKGSPEVEVEPGAFVGLNNLVRLYSDKYLFCCLIGEIEECTPPPDQFSSCEDLMRNEVLCASVWILGISALVGNGLVLVWRLKNKEKEKSKVQEFLILNLAVSDFLMGVYMIIIGSADQRYKEVYIFHADEWKSSILCKVAGLISVLSSEVSVTMLVVISLDRFWCVVFPFKKTRLNLKAAKVVAAVGWLVMLVVSIIPVLGLPYFQGSFYGRTGVCLALPLTPDRLPGWEFSISFFLVFNVICFIVILLSYAAIYITVRNSSKNIRSNRKSQEVKMAGRMLLILCTDFLCWMPVIVMGLLSLTGNLVIPSVVYAWTAVFVLPLNSALNPYLYTISTIQLRKRKVGVAKSALDDNSQPATSPHYYITLTDVKRGQQTHFIEESQLSKIASELRQTVNGLHSVGIAHGDISQSRILLHQVNVTSATKWSAELLMPKTGAFASTTIEGASINDEAIELDNSRLEQVIAIMRQKLGRHDSSKQAVSNRGYNQDIE